MLNPCLVFVDQLRDGKSISIDATLTPKDLQLIDEDSLAFSSPVTIEGTCYLAEDHLVIQLELSLSISLPCSICNSSIPFAIDVDNTYITKALSEISSGKFDFREDVREAILIEIPSFIECNEGCCPERENLEPYLKQHSHQMPLQNDDIYYPFHHLDEELKSTPKGESHGSPKK